MKSSSFQIRTTLFLSLILIEAASAEEPHKKGLQISFGCGVGFGGWITPAKPEAEEEKCDEENLEKFSEVLGKCGATVASDLAVFDSDHDDCVTCKDFDAWLISIQRLFERGDRSTDGSNLRAVGCNKTAEEGKSEKSEEMADLYALPFEEKLSKASNMNLMARYDEAELLAKNAVEQARRDRLPLHDLRLALGHLCAVLDTKAMNGRGSFASSEPFIREQLTLEEEINKNAPEKARALSRIAVLMQLERNLQNQGKAVEAEEIAREVTRLRKLVLVPRSDH